MKIGILTFHRAHNYGAVLQAFALQEYLRKAGHDVKIIDYNPPFLEANYKIFAFKKFLTTKVHVYYLLKGAAIELLTLPARTKRYKAFDSFIRSKLALSTPTVYHKEEIPKDFDAYIFGSDQIWNPKITKGFDDVYFGLFSSRPEARKIAYAASMETSTLNDEEKEYLGKSLFQMHAIGVRESKLNALLQPLVEQKIQTVADPTILCTRETFDNIAVKPDFQGKYVLVYQVRIMPETLSFAQKLADRIGGKVIQLVSTPVLTNRPGVYNCASPEEFIGWFKHADFVVTTSFHGTVFSLLYQRNFYALEIHSISMRIRSLLQDVELSERYVKSTSQPDTMPIDFTRATQRLARLQQESALFLQNALK